MYRLYYTDYIAKLHKKSECHGGYGKKTVPEGIFPSGRRRQIIVISVLQSAVGLFRHCEDYDAVPVVGLVNLGVAACSFEYEAVGINAVIVGKDVSDSLGAAL